MLKTCIVCDKSKEFQYFHKCKSFSEGIRSTCKQCRTEHREKNLEHYKILEKASEDRNKKSRKESRQKYYVENKDTIVKTVTVWRKNNPNKVKSYEQKRSLNLNYKLKKNLRNRLLMALKQNYKTGSAVKDLGCSLEEFKIYLQSKFDNKMSWDNYGKGLNCWNIDHIKPLASFDLTDIENVRIVCHYTNLQPLWCEENSKKGAK